MTSGVGAAKTLPQAAASASPSPTNPAKSGSWPLPPPMRRPTRAASSRLRTTAVVPSTSRSFPCEAATRPSSASVTTSRGSLRILARRTVGAGPYSLAAACPGRARPKAGAGFFSVLSSHGHTAAGRSSVVAETLPGAFSTTIATTWFRRRRASRSAGSTRRYRPDVRHDVPLDDVEDVVEVDGGRPVAGYHLGRVPEVERRWPRKVHKAVLLSVVAHLAFRE